MSKKTSRISFIIIAIFVALGLFLTLFQWNVPGTDKTFMGFANSIKLGLDLKGGVSAVYEAKLPDGSNADFDDSLDATIERLENLISGEGFTESTIVKQGTDRIRIEVPDISDPKEVLDLIGEPAKLEIKKSNEDTAEAVMTGDDIEKVEASYDSQNAKYGVSVTFTYEGGNKFAALTKEMTGKTIYVYIGDDEPLQLSVEEEITGGQTFISGGSISDQASAEQYALKLMSGTFNLELNLLESNVISPTLGTNALKYGIIAGLVALVLIMVFMWLIYGDFGLLADFALVVYLIIEMFLLQAIPFVQLTLPGVAGIILSLGMAVDANIIIFERIKDEYANGKKIPFAVKTGFKKAFAPIFDSNITTIIASVILYLLGNGSIQGFAITLFVGIAVSMFTSLVITRWFVKLYLPLNSTNAKKLRLKKEVQNEEI